MLGVSLASLFIQALIVRIKLFTHDKISRLEHSKALFSNLANNANSETRSGEWLTIHHLIRQTKRGTQRTHLILKEVIQRLDQIKVNALGEGNKVVVALNRRSFPASFARTTLNNVGINRALCKILHAIEFLSLFKENFPKLSADNAALLLGICHTCKQTSIALLGMHVNQRHIKFLTENPLNTLWLTRAQHTMIDKNARKLVTNSTMDKRGGY